uniref:Zona pellucida sperm-binding protein 3 n=1 Tax=Erpetoichthys calabaricus TaxID=27687 RepID=A0A8C4SAL1_ERPCA
MGCRALRLLLLAFGLPSLYFSDVSAAFAFRGSKLPSKGYKTVVIQSKDWAQQRAGSPQTVSAVCTESEVIMTINPDLFGTRHPVQASDLTLGGCGVTSHIFDMLPLPFQMSVDEMVYSFTLDYSPYQITGIPINVSSNAFNPTWVPYTSTKSTVKVSSTGLSSMTFYLGDLLSLQASVDNTNQVPLWLFVDNCVDSSATDGSAPSYTFIGNHGVNSSILHLKGWLLVCVQIFITCTLKVTLASQATDSLNKACSLPTVLLASRKEESRET